MCFQLRRLALEAPHPRHPTIPGVPGPGRHGAQDARFLLVGRHFPGWLIRGQLLQMHIRQVDRAFSLPALSGHRVGLVQTLSDLFEDVVKIESPSLSEGQPQLDERIGRGDAALGDGSAGCGPVICPKEGRPHEGVLESEDGRGEGLEFGGGTAG